MKKGFTLVELLAVIVILSVIALITVPLVTRYVKTARINSYRTSAQTVVDTSKEYVAKNMKDNDFPEGGIDVKRLSLKKGNFKSGIIKRNEHGEIEVVNLYNGKYCASGTKQRIIVEEVENLEDCNTIDTTAPSLVLKAVKVTNTSIMVNAYGIDEQTEIKSYTFQIGNEKPIEIKSNEKVASYEFKNLKSGVDYEIKVIVKNTLEGTAEQYTSEITTKEARITVKTLEVGIPTFKVSGDSYSKSKEVTIIYPEIENAVNSYQIDEDEEQVVETQEETIEMSINGEITAYTKYNGNVVKNSILILGIDDKGPDYKVEYEKTWDSWNKTKQVAIQNLDDDKTLKGDLIIKVKDIGAGLSSKPYSYDGGKTWTSKPTKSYSGNQVLRIVIRDKMGNKSYVVNEDNSEVIIHKIDTVKPTCSLKVVSGTLGTNGWYKSGDIKDVTVDFNTVEDKTYDIDGKTLIDTKANIDKKIRLNGEIKNVLTKDGIYTFVGTVIDEAGNTNTCSIEVKRDVTLPTIELVFNGTKEQNGYRSGATITTKCSDGTSELSSVSPVQSMTQVGWNNKTGVCTDKAGNTVSKQSDNYLIYVYTANSACGAATCSNPTCGVAAYNSCATWSCGSYAYACNPYACNGYSCNCTPVYGQQAYSYKCGENCKLVCDNGGAVDPTGHKHCTRQCSPKYCTGYRQVQTGTSCQTCYQTCYQSCSAPNTCAHPDCGVQSYKSCANAQYCGYNTCWHL